MRARQTDDTAVPLSIAVHQNGRRIMELRHYLWRHVRQWNCSIEHVTLSSHNNRWTDSIWYCILKILMEETLCACMNEFDRNAFKMQWRSGPYMFGKWGRNLGERLRWEVSNWEGVVWVWVCASCKKVTRNNENLELSGPIVLKGEISWFTLSSCAHG